MDSCNKCKTELTELKSFNSHGLWCKVCHSLTVLSKKGEIIGVFPA